MQSFFGGGLCEAYVYNVTCVTAPRIASFQFSNLTKAQVEQNNALGPAKRFQSEDCGWQNHLAA